MSTSTRTMFNFNRAGIAPRADCALNNKFVALQVVRILTNPATNFARRQTRISCASCQLFAQPHLNRRCTFATRSGRKTAVSISAGHGTSFAIIVVVCLRLKLITWEILAVSKQLSIPPDALARQKMLFRDKPTEKRDPQEKKPCEDNAAKPRSEPTTR